MNSTYRYLVLLAITFLVFNRTLAQKASFETNNGITIGFGLGAAYQQSDISNSEGGGFDFTLGSYLYKKENAFFSTDWKFRFLAGENMAHDHRINTDGTFSNIRFRFFNYDIELGLTLNRLRERTRIVISGFAGAGITHGMTSTDILDESGNPYDYSVIDPNLGKKQVYMDLVNLTDGNYETKLIGKAAVMPTAGIYLGYQFSRSFSLGLEHKINFSLTENNGFSGIDIDNNIVSGSRKDRNHYTSLSFRWIIRGGSSGSGPGRNYSVINTPLPVYNPPVPQRPVNNPTPVIITGSNEAGSHRDNAANIYNKPATVVVPTVKFIDPASPVTVNTNIHSITVQTMNVKEWQDVTVNVNGTDFSNFNLSTEGIVSTNIPLKEGTNRVEVTGKNQSGSASDFATITYTKPVKAIPPVINIPNPDTSPVIKVEPTQETKPFPPPIPKMVEPAQNVSEVIVEKPCPRPGINFSITVINREDATHELKGSVSNVKNKSDITFTVNDSPFEGFTYVPGTGEISSQFKFNPGSYNIRVVIKNDCGQDTYSGTVVIEEEKPCGIRINPGDSSKEFCMVTPAGIILRNSLTNSNFRYSGPASSLYFMPIAGGGNAVVKGSPYTIRPGQYYLFTGNLTVTISTNNPGSMGQWSVCIIADKEPLSGNGSNRPKSPCEEQKDKGK